MLLYIYLYYLGILLPTLSKGHKDYKRELRLFNKKHMKHHSDSKKQDLVSNIISNVSNIFLSAFCEETPLYNTRYYPTDTPEIHLPWIWDAVFDSARGYVELTTMNRSPCRFDKELWKELVILFPDYSHQLGFGKDSNILVPVDYNMTSSEESHLVGSTIRCEFLMNSKLQFTAMSYKIRGHVTYSSLGTLQIRCPVIKQKFFNSIRLVLRNDSKIFDYRVFDRSTVAVPINCEIPINPGKKKKYKLSICSATSRNDRKSLVEWIEYHKLIGIDHIFLYDTSFNTIESNESKLSDVLQDYVNEGFLNIIPWPYRNCVREMASGRWTIWFKNDTRFDFKAPYAIAQSAALASCYSRFRHTSKYMTHIDDDEFLVFSKSYFNGQNNSKDFNIINVADKIFKENPKVAAIKFEPVQFFPCKTAGNKESVQSKTFDYSNFGINSTSTTTSTIYSPLPRLGIWDQSELGYAYEGKLLMRTDAVNMFFIHYLSSLSYRKYDLEPITLPLKALTLFHYKYPYQLSNTLLGGQLPIEPHSFMEECRGLEHQDFASSDSHAKISYDINIKLKEQYELRISSN